MAQIYTGYTTTRFMCQTACGTADAAADIQDMHVRCKSGKFNQLFGCDITPDMKFIHGLKIAAKIRADGELDERSAAGGGKLVYDGAQGVLTYEQYQPVKANTDLRDTGKQFRPTQEQFRAQLELLGRVAPSL